MISVIYDYLFPNVLFWHGHFNRRRQLSRHPRRTPTMKKTLSLIGLIGFVVLTTATFGYAEYAATGAENFPYFHLGALVVGGLIIISLKKKYSRIYLAEAVGSFAMYALLVALFTAPVVEGLRNLVG
jgi:hypothetical protein